MDGRVLDIDPGVVLETLPRPELLKASGSVAVNGASAQPAEVFTEWGDGHGVDIRAEQIPDPRSPYGYTTHSTGW